MQSFLGVKADGDFGPLSGKALANYLFNAPGPAAPAAYILSTSNGASKPDAPVNADLSAADQLPVDARSESTIATLLPAVQTLMRAVVNRCNALLAAVGLRLVATSGLRTYTEQNALYAKQDGTTHVPGGYSNHNFGLACDFTLFRGTEPVWDGPEYHDEVGVQGKALGLFWGGDWKSIDDEPHPRTAPRLGNGPERKRHARRAPPAQGRGRGSARLTVRTSGLSPPSCYKSATKPRLGNQRTEEK